ncbi:hypothetical protein HC891_13935 [Candidatus Gracilibacteria bacterium]|nr:hypothetical protein [Candidatus Gracilibacteria bacterium]
MISRRHRPGGALQPLWAIDTEDTQASVYQAVDRIVEKEPQRSNRDHRRKMGNEIQRTKKRHAAQFYIEH